MTSLQGEITPIHHLWGLELLFLTHSYQDPTLEKDKRFQQLTLDWDLDTKIPLNFPSVTAPFLPVLVLYPSAATLFKAAVPSLWHQALVS